MDSLAGKVAVVTGGTRGIGLAIAERLLKEGAGVVICGRTQAGIDKALAKLKPLGAVSGYPCDVRKADDVKRFFETVGQLHILINNAGEGVFRKVGEMSVEDWHRNIDLNLNGVFYCTHEALPRITQAGGGSIINISSLAGKNAFGGGAGYNAAKAGLNLFTETLLLDHRHDKIRVCSIMPGSVNTEFAGGPGRVGGNADWMIQPEDVAETVAMVLKMPERTMVSRIEMRPSRPQKG